MNGIRLGEGRFGAAALEMRHRIWRFFAFLISSLRWIVFGLLATAAGLISMELSRMPANLSRVTKWMTGAFNLVFVLRG